MTLLLVVLLAMQAPAASAGDWQHTFDDQIIAISAEHEGNCLAVLTARELAVFTYEGRRLWSRDLTTLGTWFRGGGVALAPTCAWAAVIGTESYRYVWVLEKGGGGRYAAFVGETPTAVAISPQSDVIAVATGGSRLHLLHPGVPGSAAMLKRQTVRRTGVGTSKLHYSSDGRRLVAAWGYGAAIHDRGGREIWEARGGVCTLSLPADAAWSLEACLPPHGPQTGILVARDAKGTELWFRVLDDVAAVVSGDGTTAFVRARPEGSADGVPPHLIVLSRDGKVAVDVEVDMNAIVAVADDGSQALLRREPWNLAWYSSSGERLASQELAEEFSEVDARRNLTRLVGINGTRLVVVALESPR